tara:strand:- start:3177 stop:4037 length:861 start_codon:yes stop_codon:yes gene_type:complete
MKKLNYFLQYIFVKIFFFIFSIIGYKLSSLIGGIIGKSIGPFFRSKKIIIDNFKIAKIYQNNNNYNNIIKNMWENYGRIFSEYPHLINFKNNKLSKYLKIEGAEYLEEIKIKKKPVVFISGHFSNFELMAMQLENSGIDIAAIYRPLNNTFLNSTMEKIRINHICKNQIPKGKSGSRKILEFFKKGTSIALMIDQRVSEGVKVNFFNRPAYTTSLPAQLSKKFECEIVPVYIERIENYFFNISINKPLKFEKTDSIEKITEKLNNILESMISKNPNQWIWTHNRWK